MKCDICEIRVTRKNLGYIYNGRKKKIVRCWECNHELRKAGGKKKKIPKSWRDIGER